MPACRKPSASAASNETSMNSATDERPAANDRHDRGAAIIEVDDPDPGSHRQATMCRNQSSITRILKIRCQSLFRRRCRTGKSAEHRTEKYGTSHPFSLSALALFPSAAGRARSQLRGSHKIRQNKTRQDHLLFHVPPNACHVALGKRQTRSGTLETASRVVSPRALRAANEASKAAYQVENFASTVLRNRSRRSGFVWFMS